MDNLLNWSLLKGQSFDEGGSVERLARIMRNRSIRMQISLVSVKTNTTPISNSSRLYWKLRQMPIFIFMNISFVYNFLSTLQGIFHVSPLIWTRKTLPQSFPLQRAFFSLILVLKPRVSAIYFICLASISLFCVISYPLRHIVPSVSSSPASNSRRTFHYLICILVEHVYSQSNRNGVKYPLWDSSVHSSWQVGMS